MLKLINELNDRKIAFKTGLGGRELTTFRAGGKALITAYPESVKALESLKEISSAFSLRLFPFGTGSNVLILDGGFDGIMVSTVGIRCIERHTNELKLSAGIPMKTISEITAEYGLSGAEELVSIPATLGGMIKTNAGAFGRETGELVAEATVFDLRTGEVAVLKGSDIPFSYRSSADAFKNRIILGATLRLEHGANVKAKTEYFKKLRHELQPSLPSLGSTFKKTDCGIGAGYYIDKCGLKGTRIGGAEISEKHAGFIVNRGGASADDYLKLMELAAYTVKRKFDIDLTPEIEIIGKEDATGKP